MAGSEGSSNELGLKTSIACRELLRKLQLCSPVGAATIQHRVQGLIAPRAYTESHTSEPHSSHDKLPGSTLLTKSSALSPAHISKTSAS
jgi:hypothetical protein